MSLSDRALDAFRRALGDEGIDIRASTLATYGRTTMSAAPAPSAVLRPSTREDVCRALAVAREHSVALYPISLGKNWGWGDACPPQDGQAILDLARLNRILEIDPELGYAVIEPGVTQGQLASELARTAPEWLLDMTVTGLETSIVGNALERGTTSFSCRYEQLGGLEAVLADGTVVRSGYLEATGRVAHVQRWGVGPCLDGLFTQSNFGVVTKATLWLMPRHEARQCFLATVDDEKGAALIDRLRVLRLRGVTPTNVHVYPFPARGRGVRWAALGAVFGSEACVAAQRAAVEAALAPFATTRFFVPRTLDLRAAAALMRELDLPDEAAGLVPITDALVDGIAMDPDPRMMLAWVGGSNEQGLTAPPATADPLAEGYGLYFVWSSFPATGSDFDAIVALARTTLAARGFPPLMTVQLVTPRAAVLTTRVAFDRKRPERRAAAEATERDMREAAARLGYPPFRLGIGAANDASCAPSELAQRLRRALDPLGVIAPGRYGLH